MESDLVHNPSVGPAWFLELLLGLLCQETSQGQDDTPSKLLVACYRDVTF